MKIDFTKPLMHVSGVPLKMGDDAKAPDMTLQDAATQGLLLPQPEGGSVAVATAAFMLALRIGNSPKRVDITAAESTTIKEAIGRAFGYAPAICGPVEMLLEGDAHVVETPKKE